MSWYCINSPEKHEREACEERWNNCPLCGTRRPLSPLEALPDLMEKFDSIYTSAMGMSEETWCRQRETILVRTSDGMNLIRHLRKCWEAEQEEMSQEGN